MQRLLDSLRRRRDRGGLLHRYGPESQQIGELLLPRGAGGAAPVAVLLHGGFWRDTEGALAMRGPAAHLAWRGVAVWNVEYRRLGSGGGWPETFLDVAAAVDMVAALSGHGVDHERVAVIGHGSGGHLALWAAARRTLPDGAHGASPEVTPVIAVALAGVCDLDAAARSDVGGGAVRELMGAMPDDDPGAYALADPAQRLPLGVPQLLVHGSDDDVVPPALSESYAAAATAAGDDCRLVRVPGAGHRTVIDPSADAWAETVERVVAAVRR